MRRQNVTSPAIPIARVGRTALQVTRLGLGTVPIAGILGPVSEEQAIETVRTTLDLGMTLIDTAPLYGVGRSERLLGQALAGVPRDSYVLSTKVGRLLEPDGIWRFDFSRDAALRSLESSLERLKLDRVDIVLVHDPDDHLQEALAGAFLALAELRAQGVIGAIGAGMNQWQMEEQIARHVDVDCFLLAGRYTLLEQGALGFLEFCRERQIGVFLGGVFNSGILATGVRPGARYQYAEAPPEILARAGQLEAICARHGVPLYVAAAQFPLAHPAVTAVVLGVGSPAEMRANHAALSAALPPGLWADLRSAGLLDEAAPTPG
jgi:D-threo-aldose 1-dehydrogenase